MDFESLELYRRRFSRRIQALRDYKGGRAGAGIVTCASIRFFPFVYLLVRALRQWRSSLPIELWHMSGEVPEVMKQTLAGFGVTCVDAGRVRWSRWSGTHNAHGFKTFAIALLLRARFVLRRGQSAVT